MELFFWFIHDEGVTRSPESRHLILIKLELHTAKSHTGTAQIKFDMEFV